MAPSTSSRSCSDRPSGSATPARAQQLAEPLAAHLLEAQRDRVGGVLGVLELGHGVHEGAAAEALPGEGAFEPVEVVEDLLRRRLVGGRDQPHAALQVGFDQRVLARKWL